MQDARRSRRGGSTALLFAAQVGSAESARLLLARRRRRERRRGRRQIGAGDGGVLGSSRDVARHAAVGRRRSERGRRRATPRSTPPRFAAISPLVKALLAQGANPNATHHQRAARCAASARSGRCPRRSYGATPLVVAAAYLETDIMRALLAAGAQRRRRACRTARARCRSRLATSIEKEARPSDLAQLEHRRFRHPGGAARRRPMCSTAVGRCCSMPALTPRTRRTAATPRFMPPATSNLPAVIQLLVERGAPVNAQNKGGQTPLALTLPRAPPRPWQRLPRLPGGRGDAATSSARSNKKLLTRYLTG